jgi:PAS domain S-box-containing protein
MSPVAAAAEVLEPHLYEERAGQLFDDNLAAVHVGRDRIMARLMIVQWVFAIVVALVWSPQAYVGRLHTIHIHVYYAVFVGGLLSGVPIMLTVFRPAWVGTRLTMAVCQALWSTLLIHLTGGHLETHFHIFGSLAFIAFYRDWKALVTATVIVAGDHFLRGLVAPESIYGVADAEWWRFLEHAMWVVFEDAVLLLGIRENLREMKALATRQAQMELLNASIEEKVVTRTEELEASREQYRALVETTRSVPWHWSNSLARFTYVGPQAADLLGCAAADWLAAGFWNDRIHPDDRERAAREWNDRRAGEEDLELRLRKNDGTYASLRAIATRGRETLVGFMVDVTDQRRLEFELNQAQKLESVGRLASGIAHEINTPIQFVADSIHFVRDAFADTVPLLQRYHALCEAAAGGHVAAIDLAAVKQAEENADLDYLMENVPKALERSVEGLDRVATLVRSMKEFAHPDKKEKAAADLNRAIGSTLVIARNEYKYVADVATDFGELPPVWCHVSELNQVFLNIIVNAAHAIADQVKDTSNKGRICISTRADGEFVVVSIADSGGGIPEAVRSKVFEPFFTTKEVGRGTGQGLSIARSVVVDKHGGQLSFETTMGVGTTFHIRLPVGQAHTEALAA